MKRTARKTSRRPRALPALKPWGFDVEKRFRSMINRSLEGIAILQGDPPRYVFVNPALCRIMGYSRRELLTPPLNEVSAHMLPSLRAEQTKRFRRRLEGRRAPLRYEFPMLRRDGSAVWVDCAFTRFTYLGRPAVQAALIDVTARREADERLRQSEESYRRLIDASPNGIAVELSGKIAFINPAGMRMLGAARPRDLIGRSVLECVCPPDRRLVRREVERFERGDPPSSNLRVRFQRLDGTTFWGAAQGVDIIYGGRPATQVIVRDITASLQAEIALRQSEDRFRNMSELLPAVVFETDLAGRFTFLNKYAYRLFGFTKEDVRLGMDCLAFVAPEDLSRARARTARILKGRGLGEAEYTFIGKNRIRRPVLIHSSAIRKDGRTVGMRGVLIDLTERKRIEEQVREANQILEAALAEKEVLLREIHHRVKNNLQIISSLLFLQAEKFGDPLVREAFHSSQERISAMAQVHESLYWNENQSAIDFARFVRSFLPPLFEACGTAMKGTTLSVEAVPLPLPITVAVPCGLILNELVTNSLKHAFPGRRRRRIRIVLRRRLGGRAELMVEDDGIGLPGPARLRSTTLGFQLVSALATQIRGRVRIGRGPGTCVTVSFPLPAANARPGRGKR